MIRRLQMKFVAILMSVVTIILLAIFFTIFIASRQLNKQLNSSILHQALNMRPHAIDAIIPESDSLTFNHPRGAYSPNFNIPNERRPVLVFNVDGASNISTELNQLHFLSNEDIAAIASLVAEETFDEGNLSDYDLRYLRRPLDDGFRIAVVDISIEQRLLRKQILSSLVTVSGAFTIFLVISIFLSRLAIRPVEAAWQSQKQFISDASHELKTPLTVILSNIDMLQKDAPPNEQNTLRMEHINVEATRMKRLIEDMLTLAMSDNSTIHTFSRVNFSYIVRNIALVYEPILFDEQKTMTFNIDDGLFVDGNAPRLQQLVYILLDNAHKYSSELGTIRISLTKLDTHTLRLKISNSGEPIPESELKNIFSRFYRRDQSRSGHDSFGLGLSIAQSIVNEHGGKIWAESDVREGNCFYVSLPIS